MIVPATTPDERATLIAYMASKLGATPTELVGAMPFEIAAVHRNGKAMGAVLYINYRDTSIEIGWAGEPGWVTRQTLKQIFAYPFVQLKCLVIIGIINRSNQAAREFAKRIGGREIGVIQHAFGQNRDGLLYTMTREECAWLDDESKPVRSSRQHQAGNGVAHHAGQST